MLEEIKAIGEVIGVLGEGALGAFFWYLGYKLLVIVLQLTTLILILVFVFKLVERIIQHCGIAKDMQRALGYVGEVTTAERREMLKLFREGLTARDEERKKNVQQATQVGR